LPNVSPIICAELPPEAGQRDGIVKILISDLLYVFFRARGSCILELRVGWIDRARDAAALPAPVSRSGRLRQVPDRRGEPLGIIGLRGGAASIHP
jgi:hypothetical protein